MMQRSLGLLCSVFLILQPTLDARQETSTCGTHAERSREERYLHQRSLENRFLRTLSLESLAGAAAAGIGPASADRDLGNLAIIEDSGGVVARRNPFNLNRRTITFHPVAAGTAYAVVAGDDSYDDGLANASARVEGLGDDDFRETVLPFEFPFYGQTHRSLFINSDGNLTFGAPDGSSSDRSLGRMTGGSPRISPLFADLDPSIQSASVRVRASSEEFAVTWQNVPIFASNGVGQRQNVQLRLFPTGRIEVAYGDMRMSNESAVAGLTPGGLRGGIDLIPLGAGSDREFTGTVVDRFAGADEVDLAVAAQRFYATHEDAYDYLVIFNALGIRTNNTGAIAFEDTIRNNVSGFGERLVDQGSAFGSKRRLQAVMYMGPWEQYPADPFAPMPLRPGTGELGISVVGHEASHRFLAFVSVKDAAGRSLMFGRDSVHWGFNFNSEGSLTEGNRIVDNGASANPRFFAEGAGERLAPLDQYFFGLRPPEDVPQTFVVLNSTGPANTSAPRPGTRFNGTRRDVNIEELVEIAGPRIPDSQVAQRKYRFGWVLIVPSNQALSTRGADLVERYRSEWESYWSRVSEGRSTAEASIKRSLDVSFFPHRDLQTGETITATIRIERALEQPLTIRLAGDAAVASLPESVTLPVGETSIQFEVRANGNGVTVVTATPQRDEFETVESRIRVR